MAELQALLASTGTLRQIDLGIVADHEYFLAHGASSATAMQNIINQVDGIYRSEVGVALRVTKTVVFSTPADPFTSADPFGLLCEFSAYKTNTNDIKSTGLSHLFTGRNITDAAGIAWLGVVCNDPFTRPFQCPNLPSGNYLLSTGLSEQISTNNNIRVIITAHEIGHNFGAPHDNESGSPCASTPFGFIMNRFLLLTRNLSSPNAARGLLPRKPLRRVAW